MENNYVKCKNCKHFDGKRKCTLFCWEVYPDYTRKCSEFQPAMTKCGDCIHYANRDCPVGDGNTNDAVNHPAHYTSGSIECIDCIKAALGENYIGFLIGNVIKYAYRYKDKNGVEDLKKAQVYLAWAIKELSENE